MTQTPQKYYLDEKELQAALRSYVRVIKDKPISAGDVIEFFVSTGDGPKCPQVWYSYEVKEQGAA